jgi:tRNA(Ile)-lysidine synthase
VSRSSDALLPRCHFPAAGTLLPCAFSGGPDSTALLALACAAGCRPVAHHVDHGIRTESEVEAGRAKSIAEQLGIPFVLHRVIVEPGPNLEARARAARLEVLPEGAATGHTLDDQAETLLLRLIRGSGTTGLTAMEPGPAHPLLAIRRDETVALCASLGIEPVRDPSNTTDEPWRNRVRHELLPLAADIAERDVATILARAADLLRDDDRFLDELAAAIDPTDARAVAAAPVVLARRALRRWLTESGYPPDRASIERVLAVARGEAVGCEITGGRRIRRSGQRFDILPGGG